MSLLDLLFPKICLGCSQLGKYLCLECRSDLIDPVQHSVPGLDGCWSLGEYEGIIEQAIHLLKYQWVTQMAPELAELIWLAWQQRPPDFIQQLQLNPEEWSIVPVPIHSSRLSWRGFNQSELLAKNLGKLLKVPLNTDLKKERSTSSQVGLSASERHNNLTNAFKYYKTQQVTPNVLLVDDVWTTGSTLTECATVLKEQGVLQIWAVTIANSPLV